MVESCPGKIPKICHYLTRNVAAPVWSQNFFPCQVYTSRTVRQTYKPRFSLAQCAVQSKTQCAVLQLFSCSVRKKVHGAVLRVHTVRLPRHHLSRLPHKTMSAATSAPAHQVHCCVPVLFSNTECTAVQVNCTAVYSANDSRLYSMEGRNGCWII